MANGTTPDVLADYRRGYDHCYEQLALGVESEVVLYDLHACNESHAYYSGGMAAVDEFKTKLLYRLGRF